MLPPTPWNVTQMKLLGSFFGCLAPWCWPTPQIYLGLKYLDKTTEYINVCNFIRAFK
jgi:hypothetical protein